MKAKTATKRKSAPAQPTLKKEALRLEWRSPSELAENPRNWRRHPDSQVAALTDIIGEVGWAGACLFNERTGRLIDGHARRKVGEARGDDRIPVLVGSWSEADERKILATFDPISAMATTDAAALEALLRDVNTQSETLNDMLAGLAKANPVPVEPGAGGDEFDATPEATGPTRTNAGDLWVIGGKHRLIVGDCTHAGVVGRLMDREKAAAVVTDPPYGINQNKITNDDPEGLRVLFDGCLAALPCSDAVVAAFQSTRMFPAWLDAARDAGHRFERMLWVYKPNDVTFPWRGWILTSEALLLTTVGKGAWNEVRPFAHDCYTPTTMGKELPEGSGWHASVKPLSMVQDIVSRVSPDGAAVYDPFLGSGTTLIAAHRLGRTCYGCEIEPRYADVILKRAEAEGLAVEKAG